MVGHYSAEGNETMILNTGPTTILSKVEFTTTWRTILKTTKNDYLPTTSSTTRSATSSQEYISTNTLFENINFSTSLMVTQDAKNWESSSNLSTTKPTTSRIQNVEPTAYSSVDSTTSPNHSVTEYENVMTSSSTNSPLTNNLTTANLVTYKTAQSPTTEHASTTQTKSRTQTGDSFEIANISYYTTTEIAKTTNLLHAIEISTSSTVEYDNILDNGDGVSIGEDRTQNISVSSTTIPIANSEFSQSTEKIDEKVLNTVPTNDPGLFTTGPVNDATWETIPTFTFSTKSYDTTYNTDSKPDHDHKTVPTTTGYSISNFTSTDKIPTHTINKTTKKSSDTLPENNESSTIKVNDNRVEDGVTTYSDLILSTIQSTSVYLNENTTSSTNINDARTQPSERTRLETTLNPEGMLIIFPYFLSF